MKPRPFIALVAAQVTPVLTKEQNAEWQKMRDEARGKLAERRQRRQP